MKKILLSLFAGVTCCYIGAKEPLSSKVYIAKYKDDKACAISYTFDDGMNEHYTLVAPQLEKHGFKGTFWVCGGFIEDTEGGWLTWEQVKEMADRGHEMSNHSWSHRNMTQISREEVIREIEKNDSALLAITGKLPLTFCYPYNALNQEVFDLAIANRVGTRTREYAIGTASTPEKLEQWIEGLLSEENWGVAMIHGINHGYDAFTNPSVLWDHFEQVKAQENRIWIGTFREVAAYTEAQKQVSLQITELDNRLSILPELNLNRKLFNEPLTLVVEKQGREIDGIQQNGKFLSIHESEDKIVFDFDPYDGEITIEWIQ